MEANKQKVKILLEMRPALEGFAGIPQEVRLLYRGLMHINNFETNGLLQASHKVLNKGLKERGIFSDNSLPPNKKLNKLSKAIISLAERPFSNKLERILGAISTKIESIKISTFNIFGNGKIQLTRFESLHFKDFIWRTLFSKTLPASDFELVTKNDLWVCSTPWRALHKAGLSSISLIEKSKYPMIDTSQFDIFIGQTPFPGRVHKNTKVIIRYHDAIPVFMPHTIPEKSFHQASHYHALKSNVENGAYFACVSESTRQELITLFPEADKNSLTIHNMVSHNYFIEDSNRKRINEIIRSRINRDTEIASPNFLTIREQESFYRKHLNFESEKYLLVVSTIEPRKNHSRLVSAWEVLRSNADNTLKLVIVGSLGWDCDQILKSLKPWVNRGQVFLLSAVPAPDLRVLYRHAATTVCPSLGEGFDFSGVESMASGGLTLASDIPVHREIYGDAAGYFDPYSTGSLVALIEEYIYSKKSTALRKEKLEAGKSICSQYLPETVLPKWENLFRELIEKTPPLKQEI